MYKTLTTKFHTISKIQTMLFRPANNLYEFSVFYKTFLCDEIFYNININKIFKKSLLGNNTE